MPISLWDRVLALLAMRAKSYTSTTTAAGHVDEIVTDTKRRTSVKETAQCPLATHHTRRMSLCQRRLSRLIVYSGSTPRRCMRAVSRSTAPAVPPPLVAHLLSL